MHIFHIHKHRVFFGFAVAVALTSKRVQFLFREHETRTLSDVKQ